MSKEAIILVGGGGHCKSTIDVIESENKYEIKGVIDVPENVGKAVLGYHIIGSDADLEELARTCNNFIITAGQIKSSKLRTKLFDLVKAVGGKLPVIVSSNAHVSQHAKIGEGTVVFHNTVVNANAEIGSNCILNTRSIIEHDAVVGSNCHVSTGAIINGDSKLGSNSFLGSSACISSQVEVGSNCIVGAGSVVVKNIVDNTVVVGNPAKEIKK